LPWQRTTDNGQRTADSLRGSEHFAAKQKPYQIHIHVRSEAIERKSGGVAGGAAGGAGGAAPKDVGARIPTQSQLSCFMAPCTPAPLHPLLSWLVLYAACNLFCPSFFL